MGVTIKAEEEKELEEERTLGQYNWNDKCEFYAETSTIESHETDDIRRITERARRER